MFTITVKLDEKVSTSSQYENRCAGVFLEQSNIEVASPEELVAKATGLFDLARRVVDEQLGRGTKAPEPTHVPSTGNNGSGNGHSNGSGHASAAPGNGHGNGQGNGRKSYGRPLDPPTPKQRNLLRGIAKRRNLGPETIRDLCQRVVGKDPKDFTKVDMMKLLDHLLQKQEAA